MEPVLAKKPISPETTARKRHPIRNFLKHKVVPLAKGALVVLPAGIAMWTLVSTKDAIAQTKGEAKEKGKGGKELALSNMPADTAKAVKGSVPVKTAQAQIPGSIAGVHIERINAELLKDGFYYTSFFGIDRSLDPNLYYMVDVAIITGLAENLKAVGIDAPSVDENRKIICKKYDGKDGTAYIVGPKGFIVLHLGEKGLTTGTASSANEMLSVVLFPNGWMAGMTNTDFLVGSNPDNTGVVSLKRIMGDDYGKDLGRVTIDFFDHPQGPAFNIDAASLPDYLVYVHGRGFFKVPKQLLGQNEFEPNAPQVAKK